MSGSQETCGAAGQSFRASFWGSTLFLLVSALTAAWSVVVILFTDAPEIMDAIAWLLGLGCVIVGTVMIYRMLWRPVMIHVDARGLYLKTHDAVIPWDALEGARLARIHAREEGVEKKSGDVVELIAAAPLHPSLKRNVFETGRRLNQLAGLPDYCISMDGVEGSNAMLLASLSFYTRILPPEDR